MLLCRFLYMSNRNQLHKMFCKSHHKRHRSSFRIPRCMMKCILYNKTLCSYPYSFYYILLHMVRRFHMKLE